MKEYNFQSVNQKKALILFVTLFTLFFTLIFGMTSFKNIFNVYVTMIFSFGTPILIFWLNKKRIKDNCVSKISEKNTEIKIKNKLHIIDFDKIKSYKIESYNNSASLNIMSKDGTKFNLTTNSSFAETKHFEDYCTDLGNAIEIYKTTNNIEIEKGKTFFQRSWVFPFLVLTTILLLIFVIVIISKGEGFSGSLISALAPLLILWGGYYNNKNNKK